MTRISESEHYDRTGGAPLRCSSCGVEQTIEETAHDPLMYERGFAIECDGCREAREDWALFWDGLASRTVTAWEG